MGHETFETSSTVFTRPHVCCEDYKDGGKAHDVCESMELDGDAHLPYICFSWPTGFTAIALSMYM